MERSQARQEPKSSTSAAKTHLLTPEEPMVDSFTQPLSSFVPIQTASPPASPEFRSFPINDGEFSHSDPVLYPENKSLHTGNADKPLFATSVEQWPAQNRGHSPASENSSAPSTPSLVHSPVIDDELLPDAGVDTVAAANRSRRQNEPNSPETLFQVYGYDYFKYMMDQNDSRIQRQKEARRLPPLTATQVAIRRDPYTSRIVQSLGQKALAKSHRVEKSGNVAQPTPRPKTLRTLPVKATTPDTMRAVKDESPAKRHRRHPSTPDVAVGGLGPSSQPKPRTRAPPTKNVNGKDLNWQAITDYAPPASTLDEDHSKPLHVEWTNGNRLDLDNDPDREHLHSEELRIAGVLRLKCAQYLMSKRRIFESRVEHLKENKEFNKTSAQACTSIDVNKASRLWDAFNKVGWFDEKWYQKYLE